MLSALAGSGLTAGLAVQPSVALGAAGPAGTAESGEGATGPLTTSTAAPAPVSPEAAGQPSNTTSTTVVAPPPPSRKAPSTKTPAAPTAPTTGSGTPQAPTVVLQRRQRKTVGKPANPNQTATANTPGATNAAGSKGAGANNVALSPQLVAGQAAALSAALASSAASVQALGFYRIPLFLLPIYKAAGVQYGVPWQILAAINEIETNYGTDQSVSTAGAVGWMQFMPETWLQYGVDALDAGYADPYNPVDAIFAAARYLRAAGAATDLHAAILAYNHSEEYVASVLLRAKLISSYPKNVIATLTGLTDGRLPITGKQLAWAASLSSVSSATANAARVPPAPAAATSAPSGAPASAPSAAATNAAAPAPAATAAAAAATKATAAAKAAAAQTLQLVELTSAPDSSVVAVQDGRVVDLGHSRQLGKFVVLRDVYGDLFTYAGLGSIAPTYTPAKPPRSPVKSPVIEAASTHDPTPSHPASAGNQPPVTLKVKAPVKKAHAASVVTRPQPTAGGGAAPPSGAGKVRLFAHPGNPDAVAAAGVARRANHTSSASRQPLRRGSVVETGTVLGRLRVPLGAKAGHMRFAIRPAGDSATIDPRPILANWAQLEAALHPQGAKAENALLGATASDVLLMSKAQLERTVLADPGVALDACSRHEIAAGKIDKRVLATLAFLSRSGLKPKVAALQCGHGQAAVLGAPAADAVDISAINGVAIAGHQGAGTITDLTIRTLLTLPAEFVPHAITSLMRYPGASGTHAVPAYWNRVRLAFQPARPAASLTPAAAARSARSGRAAPSPLLTPTYVSGTQWEQLITRIGALPAPSVKSKPSSAAIADPKHP
ncbi:MAG: peptidoglycan DD-metalloendopeptidase family protein [Solirubrobacterales bacterium]|nr:peptidoglycan DD-metalloendopeptidase family protein [Solirubrobacterales bacterium]